eukprot:GSChrysophyteH1.ASY1.ANO1.1273.1 assembled CDS
MEWMFMPFQLAFLIFRNRDRVHDSMIPRSSWIRAADKHAHSMQRLLYPNGNPHEVKDHPIYNFLHIYYKFSVREVQLYSPGLTSPALDEVHIEDIGFVASFQDLNLFSRAPGRYKRLELEKNRDILHGSLRRIPNFACHGLHEWAMLYKSNAKMQTKLRLRVPQSTIDSLVKGELGCSLRCTHFDAFRFFHPDAKPLNAFQLSRDTQVAHEQGGCIHATMDLFKHAYSIFPLISSSLLRRSLELAFKARYLDMRSSPYDVSMYRGCEDVIEVETERGRKKYREEQMLLWKESSSARRELLEVYEKVLGKGMIM